MSNFSSVQDTFLDKRINKLGNELIQFKAKQRYGGKNYQTFFSNSVSFSNRVYNFSDSSWGTTRTGTSSSTNVFHVRFTGNKPHRAVQGKLLMSAVVTGVHGSVEYNVGDKVEMVYYAFLQWYPGDNENEVDFIVQIHGGTIWDDIPSTVPQGYFDFEGRMQFLSTDVGKLDIIETFDAQQYFGWT